MYSGIVTTSYSAAFVSDASSSSLLPWRSEDESTACLRPSPGPWWSPAVFDRIERYSDTSSVHSNDCETAGMDFGQSSTDVDTSLDMRHGIYVCHMLSERQTSTSLRLHCGGMLHFNSGVYYPAEYAFRGCRSEILRNCELLYSHRVPVETRFMKDMANHKTYAPCPTLKQC